MQWQLTQSHGQWQKDGLGMAAPAILGTFPAQLPDSHSPYSLHHKRVKFGLSTDVVSKPELLTLRMCDFADYNRKG